MTFLLGWVCGGLTMLLLFLLADWLHERGKDND